MPRSSRPPVPIALGSASTDTEEGRAFFQSRLRLFGGWILAISTAFYLVITVIRVAFGIPFLTAHAFHLLSMAVAAGLWAAGRMTRLSVSAARMVDVAGTLALCASLSLMVGSLALTDIPFRTDGLHELMIGLLGCSFVLIARAIALPSPPVRTMWVSAAGISTLLAAAVWVYWGPSATGAAPFRFIDLVTWSIAAVAMATVASRVIFGLRAEVSKVRQLGQYTLEEKIGEGGMGTVYRARHALLRRPTAIKLLPPESAGEDTIQRFEREVQLTAGLSHPSTVSVFDYGRTHTGVFYYAMEFLDGVNLQHLVEIDGPQPAGRVIHILQQVCGALAEAHGIGLIHRDIKPANIILCQRGGLADVAKVVDFGLVKRVEPAASDATMAVTGAHTVLGTPLYLAPEAFAGGWAVDARCDLYAVGAVGYFLLTGGPVFTGTSVVEIGAHHLHTSPERPSIRARRFVPDDVERLILQCLAKAPPDRPPDALTLQRALTACGRTTPWPDEESSAWWAGFRRRSAG